MYVKEMVLREKLGMTDVDFSQISTGLKMLHLKYGQIVFLNLCMVCS